MNVTFWNGVFLPDDQQFLSCQGDHDAIPNMVSGDLLMFSLTYCSGKKKSMRKSWMNYTQMHTINNTIKAGTHDQEYNC